MRKQRTVRGNTKRINRRKVSGKSIRLKGHSVLNRRKGRTSAPDVPAEIWGCWRREKALRAQQEEDGAPCRGTESRAIGVAGVRFPCRALGLLVIPAWNLEFYTQPNSPSRLMEKQSHLGACKSSKHSFPI